jgi:di/tricarboxylate transporter
MSPAVLALLALLLAIALSMTTRVNVGLLSIALAWVVGVFGAGMTAEAVIAGFPASLFITLAGVTLLFAVAKANGTLDVLADLSTALVRGHSSLLPLVFFLLAGIISTVGPGAIASVALVAPLAMPIGIAAGVPTFLSAIAIGTGANAGNLSPISSVGAAANTILARIGLGGHEWKLFAANFIAHVIVALAAYVFFGGVRLLRAGRAPEVERQRPSLDRRQGMTIAVTGLWMAATIWLKVNPGLAAFAAAALLIVLGAADDKDVIARMPLDVILMVTGVTVLIGVLEKTGGMDLFTGLIGRIAGPSTLNGVIAFVVGVISTYSSTSGVVLPAFLPMVPGLVRDAGGGDPLAVAISINVGSALVDVSPLSTLGALCVATISDRAASRDLFKKLLIWGLSMAVVGALLCGLFAGPFARM